MRRAAPRRFCEFVVGLTLVLLTVAVAHGEPRLAPCQDADGDGFLDCLGDCDDTNPHCTSDCTDADRDGYCVTADCDDLDPECSVDCTDPDEDGYCGDIDCNNNLPACTTDCTDADGDEFCALADCDDANPNCTTDCTDADADGFCATVDCDDSDPDCSIDCTDPDGDGYCGDLDCNNTFPECTINCTDADGDGVCAAVDCDDAVPGCDTDCTDGDGDGYCPPYDCDDAEPHNADTDGDGVPDRCDSCPLDADRRQSDFDAIDGETPIGNSQTHVKSLVAADLDGDGDNDVLAAGYTDDGAPDEGTIEFFRSSSGGSSWFRHVVDSSTSRRYGALAADLDGDEDLDILYSMTFSLRWLRNVNGAGEFTSAGQISSLHGRTAIFAADLDGDGDLDVLASGDWGAAEPIAWFENLDGLANFGPARTVSTSASYLKGFVAADVDGDGDMDVVVGTADHAPYNKVLWHENLDGQGNFGDEIVLATNLETYAVAVADLNSDTHVDILAMSISHMQWFESTDGTGSFTPGGIVPIEISPSTIQVADLDGDGDNDILNGDGWHENLDGMGNFGPSIEIPGMAVPQSAKSVVAADLDGDGDTDVVAARGADDRISWFEARGDGVGDVCDCAPSDPSVAQPPEVPFIALAKSESTTARILWAAVPGADTYSITRGSLGQIGVGEYGPCLIQGMTATEYDDEGDPGSGVGFTYLIRTERSACGSGPLGFTSEGAVRVNLDPEACP